MKDPTVFRNGVSYYTHGTLFIDVSFPEDKVCCAQCDFCKQKYGMQVFQCFLTQEPILQPEKGIGNQCPITFPEVNDE